MGREIESGPQEELEAAQPCLLRRAQPGPEPISALQEHLKKITQWFSVMDVLIPIDGVWEGALGIYRNQRSLSLVLQPPDPSWADPWLDQQEESSSGAFSFRKKGKSRDFLSQGFPSSSGIWFGGCGDHTWGLEKVENQTIEIKKSEFSFYPLLPIISNVE